ncbi:MATE family efflux transporter [Enterococcus hulanensis]|uniref:MATE family efflux transporter n=1 Tax=Enterococcus hulanensis TaxID=2559929 RepID=UPI001A8DC051|nr:MATE family efflux transporter [Enterococcus hulanensis]MBO0458132.1 MATE family efflux transporter [Enterococcus hulanensis]
MFTNKDLKKLLVPLVIEQALVMMVGIADTMMVSYAGEAAISGVSLVDMVNNLIMFVLTAIATGGAVIVSQYLGNKDRNKTNYSASQLITLSVIIATVIMLICVIFSKLLLRILFGSVSTEVMHSSVTYFVICSFSLPFLGLYNASAALFRSMSKTNVTMYVSLLMNLINVVGNAIGIFVFEAGVVGVAVPTLISRIVVGVVMFYFTLNRKNQIYVQIKQVFSWNIDLVKRILAIAVPNGIENGLFYLGKVVVTSIIALFGTTQIAANGVSNSINQIVPIVVNAINLGIVTVVGRCVGANEYEQADYYIKKLMKISYIATAVLNIVVFLALPIIFNFYSLSPEVEKMCYVLVIWHNIMAMLLHPTSFVLANGIRAAGDVKYTMYSGIFSMVVFRLGAAILFGIVLNYGIYGVWIAMGLDWLSRSLLFLNRYRSNKWEEFKAI